MPVRREELSLDDFYIRVAVSPNPGESYIQKFGRNPDIDSAAPEDIWDRGGLWVAPTTGRIHDIVSTDANDTGAGTGAQTVDIFGLDTNYDEQNETVTLNGITNVPTVGTYQRIFRMIVRTAGSGGSNVGTITATAQVDATVTAQINPANNQTLMAIYTIPNGKRGALQSIYASIIKSQAVAGQVFLYFREEGAPWRVAFFFGLASDGTTTHDHVFTPPAIGFPKTDIRLLVDVTANNADVAGGFSIVLFNDPEA